ncbi:50S ribosomal protein L13 [Sediminitomix flava]|uniref:Large ribosomal subunit protein uL13 n=1 Tax=Sediminitomix flava TaxID=379075 RepID=A0A315Z6H7_SEDFL|nr:50S ribosomal protein L13 [Sediminitomix flava]PWJ39131.1 LSU ribosomal protein L13P [Sediminitomix flava]
MDTLSYKTQSANKSNIKKEWFIVDATDLVLGRLGSEVAKVLRGKHKPSFTPHADCGDNVIIINADKVKLTGDKWDAKLYIRHTGYPGGQRQLTAKELMAKKPFKMVENAVKGMLPKGVLGRKIYRNLFVYAGAEHPHEAQQPKELKF